MRRFKYRLERVLHYRQVVKDEKKNELYRRNMLLQEAEQQLEWLEQAALRNKLSEQGVIPPSLLSLSGLYAARLEREIVDQKLAVIEADQAVEEARQEYIEAAKEAEALVLLKQKRFNEYLDYVNKEEGKQLDELAVQKGNKSKRVREVNN